MNTRATPPSDPRPIPPLPPKMARTDREFLPAALEILETPPSPVGIWLLWIICILAASALAWGWLGRIDVVAVAQGKVQPAGRVKVIQPLETGRIRSVHVENGQHVRAGDVLLTFDSSEADADSGQIKTDITAYAAEATRRRAALDAISDRAIDPIPEIGWQADVPADVRFREEAILAGDLGKLGATIEALRAQIEQKQRERQRLVKTVRAVGDLVATLQTRVDMRSSLNQSGSGSKADLIDALETLQEQQASLVSTRGQLAESDAAVGVLERDIEDAFRTFIADNLQKLSEAERRVDSDRQALEKARARQARTVLKSPIDGTVSALSVTTIGQVVGAGEETMRIVPSGSALEIEAYVLNKDIGFVRGGEEAVVKVESLPFTRYGTIDAIVDSIADDAIPEPDAAQREGNPIQSTRDRGFAGAQRTQNLVFPATFRLEKTSLEADGVQVLLTPGMAVTVEIKTGSRRILEYLFSPLLEVGSEAMKER